MSDKRNTRTHGDHTREEYEAALLRDIRNCQVAIGDCGPVLARAAELSLRATPRMAIHVAPDAARHIETEAFQMLGHDLAHGEWVSDDHPAAMAAVWAAYLAVSRRMPVIPGISPEDAKKMRIALAKRAGVC